MPKLPSKLGRVDEAELGSEPILPPSLATQKSKSGIPSRHERLISQCRQRIADLRDLSVASNQDETKCHLEGGIPDFALLHLGYTP